MPLTPSLDSIARLREASRRDEVGLVDFARLLGERRDLSHRVLALEQLCAEDPCLERRLVASILPGVVRLASALDVSAEAPLEPHLPGLAARTSVPRALVARWLAHALLGTLEPPPPPSPDYPKLDFGPLLAATHPWEQAKLRCLIEYFARVTEVPRLRAAEATCTGDCSRGCPSALDLALPARGLAPRMPERLMT